MSEGKQRVVPALAGDCRKAELMCMWIIPRACVLLCPECGQEHAVYDHSAERVWRHLDSCQFMTYLHASLPRVSCSEHGVRQARLPWADEENRFTHLFEALAVNVLLAANIEHAAGLLHIIIY